MGFEIGHVPPHKGYNVVEEPIRNIESIKEIKGNLYTRSKRDYAIFVVGINTAFRCGDLIKITVGDVRGKNAGDDIVIREEKTGKLRRCTLNSESANAIQKLLQENIDLKDHDFLFRGLRGQMTVSYINRLVKRWCKEAGLTGQFGSHSLRKTFSFMHYSEFKTPIEVLMIMLNHSSPRQTLAYIGIQASDLKEAYLNSI